MSRDDRAGMEGGRGMSWRGWVVAGVLGSGLVVTLGVAFAIVADPGLFETFRPAMIPLAAVGLASTVATTYFLWFR